MKPLASIRTSKGCPYRCKFCAQWKVAGDRYFTRDPRRIIEEIAGIEEEYVFFADDESLVDRARFTRLAQLIREAGIRKRYFLYGRSDTITRNPQLLKLWREIGLERVFVGLEFARDEDLRDIGKQCTARDNSQAVQILQDLGIEVYASFIIRPSFTRADFAVLTPLPGTDLYQEVSDQLITRNTVHVDFVHTLLPTRLPLEAFYAEYHRLYTRAIPFAKQVAVLRELPLREIPRTFLKGRRVLGRLKTAYLDYASPGAGVSS